MRSGPLVGITAALSLTTLVGPLLAQQPPGSWTAPPGQYPPPAPYAQQPGAYPAPGYGAPPAAYPSSKPPKSTALEIGYLYVTAGAYGIGTGIWINAEAEILNPGLSIIFPAVLGVAAPVGVYFLDTPPMPRGLPSAIATGMIVGAGEGLGFASYQWVTSTEADEWGFKGLARSEFIGATVGGAGGYLFGRFLKPSPKSNIFVGSSIFWGSLIGSEIGGGASSGTWGESNDAVALGGLIGFNVALAGSAGLSFVWVPSWDQIGWMWGGVALGTVASLPVYIFYAGSDYDPRGGLIFQGVAATLGLGAGALIGTPDRKGAMVKNEQEPPRPKYARVLGGGPMPLPSGVGAQVFGELG